MAKRDPRVRAYIAKAAPFARPILRHLRRVVHHACPEAQETIKWGMPAFDHRGPLAHMAAFQEHAVFTLWKAELLGDAGKKIRKPAEKAMGQFGRLTSIADLPPERTLVALVKQVAVLNATGIQRKRKAKPKPTRRAPGDLSRALAAVPAARSTYQGLSPSQKREYVEWVTEAKAETTRARRIAQAVAWMAQGKPRNWKYMKKW